MLLNKLKTMMSVLLVLGIVGFGGGWLSHHAAVGQQVPTRERESEKSTNRQEVPLTKDDANLKLAPPKAVLKKETLQAKEGKVLQVALLEIRKITLLPETGVNRKSRRDAGESRDGREPSPRRELVHENLLDVDF